MAYTDDNDRKLELKHQKEELEKRFGKEKKVVIPPLTPEEGIVVRVDSKTIIIKKKPPTV